MTRFFHLHTADCPLVRGASGAALYDFRHGHVLAVPPEHATHLDKHHAMFVLPESPPPFLSTFLNSLAARGVGSFQTHPHVDPDRLPDGEPEKLEFAWLEITRTCNLRCVHCYAGAGPQRPGRPPMRKADWLRVLSQLRAAGLTAVQFVGGEPLLVSFLPALLSAAAGLRFAMIEVFTNATRVDAPFLRLLAAIGGRIGTTLYSADAAVHDAVTGKPGSFAVTVAAVRQAREYGTPVRVGCVVTRVNEGRLGRLDDLVGSLGARYDGEDPVRPTGRGNDPACHTTFPRAVVSPPFGITERTFLRHRAQNPCWGGKLAILDDGAVLPCVFARDWATGNVRQQELAEVLRGAALRDAWGFTKDRIDTCRDCEYRYACFDCRPLAMGMNGGRASAQTHGCVYRPDRQ